MSISGRSLRSHLNTLLGVEPGEERLVGLLAALYFVLAVSFVFVQTTAYALFIDEFGARNLPFAYLSIALFSSSIAFLYLKLSERVAFRALLFANLAFLAAVSAAFWLGLRSHSAHWFVFFLPFWFQTLLNLANLLVWPLAGRVFDVRQAKRLFGLVGAGNWLANIVVGFVVAPILALTGAADMYLLAAIAIVASGFVLRGIFRGFLPAAMTQPAAETSRAQRPEKPASSPFQQPYSRLIFAYVLLWWVSFYFIDNIFYDRAGAQFAAGADLAAFIGRQLSVIGIMALLTSTLLTGRVIRRFGLRAGMAIMPVLVTVSTAVLVVAGMAGASVAVLFWIAAVAKTLNVALGFSLSQAAGVLTYQPIIGNERNRTQTIAEGMVQPAAIGAAGLLLLLFNTVLHFGAVGLSVVFLAIAALWLWVIQRLSARYPTVLSEALVKRSLGDSTELALDPAGIAQLRSGLKNPHAGAALYALNQLEHAEPDAWHTSLLPTLPELLAHPSTEVRRYVVFRILTRRLRDTVPLLRDRLVHETDGDTCALLLRGLATLDGSESAAQIDAALVSPDLAARQAVLVGLLENGQVQRVERAQGILAAQVESRDEAARLMAAHVLSEAACPGSMPLLRGLLADDSLVVRQAALRAAARQDGPGLIDSIVSACDSPDTALVAEQALITKGPLVTRAVVVAFLSSAQLSPQPSSSLVRVLGALGGDEAIAALRSRLDTPNAEVRLQVLRALSGLGYRLRSRRELHAHIRAEVAEAAWITAAIRALERSGSRDAAVLIGALQSAFVEARARVMLLLSLGMDAQALLRAEGALNEAGGSPSAFAVETVDALLPPSWKALVLPLVESLPAAERLSRWQLAGIRAAVPETDELLNTLLATEAGVRFSAWTRLCAAHLAGALRLGACAPALQSLSSSPDDQISDMACWGLARLGLGGIAQGETHMLSLVEKVLALKSSSLFSQTPDDVLADVAGRVQELNFDPDEVIVRKGDRGDSFYIIVSGRVQVWDEDRMLNELGDGSIFGELALLDPAPRSATVKAIEPVHLLQLDASHFRVVLAERPEVSAAIIRVLTSYLRGLLRGHEAPAPAIEL